MNRIPFDLPEAEAELVAGFHTEFSGFRWALYMLGESANTFVVCCVAVTLFLGGWLRPFPNVTWLEIPLGYVAPAAMIAGPGLASFYLARKIRGRAERIGLIAFAALLTHCGRAVTCPDGEPRGLRTLLVFHKSRSDFLSDGVAPWYVTAFPL